MGRTTPIDTPGSTAEAAVYFVGRDAEGRWIVRDARGLAGGVFVDRAAAVRFATLEAARRPNAAVLLPPEVELTLSGALPVL